MGTHHQFYGTEKQLPMGSHEYQWRNPKSVSHEIWNPTAWNGRIRSQWTIVEEYSADIMREIGSDGV